jgi:hypothetical protein
MNMFKNPMMIMMGLSAVMMFVMPKMMANIREYRSSFLSASLYYIEQFLL